MAISITVHQVTSVEGPDTYRVDNEVTASTEVNDHIFVFNTEDVFSHVATAYDMSSFPTTKALAITAGLSFYRASSVIKDYDRISDAANFAVHSLQRVDALVQELQTLLDGFVHDITHTI